MSQHTIQIIEERLRNIFAKDNITQLDINNSKELFHEWKFLTDYVSDKTPILLSAADNTLDRKPSWQVDKEIREILKQITKL